jgi:HPr kinase/phosphorylase
MVDFLFRRYLAPLMRVHEIYERHCSELELELIAGACGLKRNIALPDIDRPGLGLVGYLKGFARRGILIFGKSEIEYLKPLPSEKRRLALKKVCTKTTPFALIAHSLRPFHEMVQLCEEQKIPLLRSRLTTIHLMNRLSTLLSEEFSPSLSCHASLVEIFGMGVLIQGDASIGKSEAALGLIERGHRLISDDIVKIRKREGKYLEGFGVDITRHQMEVKGIGIVNIAKLYGAAGVREKKSLDIVVKLEVWNDSHIYNPSVLKENTISFLGVEVPFHILQVKPGRNVVLLLETIALNHKLKVLTALERKGRSWENNI